MNHYEVLNVARDADPVDIKYAYRRLAMAFHPDRRGLMGATMLVRGIGS